MSSQRKDYVIRVGPVTGYDLYLGDVVVISSDDPKKLSKHAFANGAGSVRWDMDLTIVEDRK